MSVFPVCIQVDHSCYTERPEDDMRSSGYTVADNCELACGCLPFHPKALVNDYLLLMLIYYLLFLVNFLLY